MGKELSPHNRAELEIAQKRELLEETLTAKMLRERREKTAIKEDAIVFRIVEPFAFQDLIVMKIDGDKAEVILSYELKENKPLSMLSFNVSELWDQDDYFAVRDGIAKMGDVEIAEKISQPNLTD